MDDLIKGLKALFKLNQEMRDLSRANDAHQAQIVALLEEQTKLMRTLHDGAIYPAQAPQKKAG